MLKRKGIWVHVCMSGSFYWGLYLKSTQQRHKSPCWREGPVDESTGYFPEDLGFSSTHMAAHYSITPALWNLMPSSRLCGQQAHTHTHSLTHRHTRTCTHIHTHTLTDTGTHVPTHTASLKACHMCAYFTSEEFSVPWLQLPCSAALANIIPGRLKSSIKTQY